MITAPSLTARGTPKMKLMRLNNKPHTINAADQKRILAGKGMYCLLRQEMGQYEIKSRAAV